MLLARSALILCLALAALPCAAAEIACTGGADDDGDGLADCLDADCVADAACAAGDWDGDARPNGIDCAPLDRDAWAIPAELVPLWVLAGLRPDDALLFWPDVHADSATSVTYDVVSGRIEELRATRDFRRAVLLVIATPYAAASDSRAPGGDHLGFWYLVREVSACDAGPTGSAELDADRRFDESPTHCANGIDDDGDRLFDCGDPQCSDSPDCPEDCLNNVDDDADGLIDCDDEECSDPSCDEEPRCMDGRDNDGDGLADCDDPDCTNRCAETCDDGIENDADGDVDCADSECALFAACREAFHCADGIDNDVDGLTDCMDPQCSGACPEDCANGTDDDADRLVDCADSECRSQHACCDGCPISTATIAPSPSCQAFAQAGSCYRRFLRFTAVAGSLYGFSTCGRCGGSAAGDTILRIHAAGCALMAENDDCPVAAVGESELFYRATTTGTHVIEVHSVSDADAWTLGYWLATDEPSSGSCSNGTDDDGDGAADCLDSDCAFDPACAEDCTNGLDDDGDGVADCPDLACEFDPACDEDCVNGLDDDGDGRVDCDDGACWGAVGCPELDCNDGIDDDLDGRIDCADFDCDHFPACIENCTNRGDDDGDGLADCLDDGCLGTGGCCETCRNPGPVLPEPVVSCRTWIQPATCATRVAQVFLRAGSQYRFSTCAGVCGGQASWDTILAVYDDSCRLVVQNDDSCGLQSTVHVTCTRTGFYRLVLRPLGGMGAFRLGYSVTSCGALPECLEALACSDGADNDGNGLTDCDDPSCASTACAEAGRCTDGTDNDTDMATDCGDPDCAGDPAC